jgi:uncharacterized protein
MKHFVTLLFSIIFSVLSNSQSPLIIGKVDTLKSSILKESRILNIYLPLGYHSDSLKKYPVIYLLDGSVNEDFLHIVGLTQFLTMTGKMPESIVVGIANIDRKRDFCFPTTIEQDKKNFPTTGGSAAFMNFLEKEVQPYIEKQYSVSSKTIIGQSLGGLVTTEIMIKHPSLFDNYIIISPSLWWDNESLLKELTSEKLKEPLIGKFISLSVGKEHPTMVKDARQMNKQLKSLLSKDQLRFDYLENEDHATILHLAVYRALEEMYKQK